MTWLGMLIGLGLLTGCGGTKNEPSAVTGTAHWSIDRCRLTYDGKLVPLGEGIVRWVEVFGPPSDSESIFGKKDTRWKGYYWDGIGLSAGSNASGPPDHIQVMGVYFGASDEPDIRPREPRGSSTFPIRVDGKLLDQNGIERLILQTFDETSYNFGEQTRFLKYLLDSQMVFTIGPGFRRDKSLRALGFGLQSEGEAGIYRTAVAKLDANCQLPENREEEEKSEREFHQFLEMLRSMSPASRDSLLKNALTPKYMKDPRYKALRDSLDPKHKRN